MLRQYSAALKVFDQLLDISPDNADALAWKAVICQDQGNLPGAAALLSRLHPDPTMLFIFNAQINQWTYERHFDDAIAALKDAIARRDRHLEAWQENFYTFNLALLQQFSGNTAAARATWQQVQTEAEKTRSKGEYVNPEVLASAYAGLGDKAKAFAIVKEGQALAPSKDTQAAAGFRQMMARIAARAGERELALEQLAISAQESSGVTYGDVKLNPEWDSLRGDPRFEKIVASLAPTAVDK